MEREELNKRKGMISFTPEFLRVTDFDIVSEIFSRFIPLNIVNRMQFFSPILEFQGVCPDFEPLKEGEVIPYYNCIIQTYTPLIDSNQCFEKPRYKISFEKI